MATALTLGLGLLATVPAQAQTATFAPVQGQVRAFPPQALRGTRVVSSASQAVGEEVDQVARRLAAEHDVRTDRALEVLAQLRAGQ